MRSRKIVLFFLVVWVLVNLVVIRSFLPQASKHIALGIEDKLTLFLRNIVYQEQRSQEFPSRPRAETPTKLMDHHYTNKTRVFLNVTDKIHIIRDDRVGRDTPSPLDPPLKAKRHSGDTDYRHDSQYLQYMKCSTTIRHKMANNSKFIKNYVADVPILVSHGDINVAEYNRLKNFRDMMGWKHSGNYETIENALSLLNTPNNRHLFGDRLVHGKVPDGDCIRCAVVGNGGILKGSRKGHVIDSHDYVFRTNVALTKGYEEDVGNKTSFYCFGMVTLSNSIYGTRDTVDFRQPPWNPGIRYVFMPENDWAYRYIYAALNNKTIPRASNGRYAKRAPILFPKPLKAEDIKVIHPDFCRYIDKSWIKSAKLRTGGRATTGAIMLFLALHTCDEVNAFGFMGDPKKFTSHYYDRNFTKSGLKGVSWHDWEAENKLWKLLMDAGVLNVYTRD